MTKAKLNLESRREVADATWRLFMLISPRATFCFSRGGVTISIPFNEDQDLEEETQVVGVIKDVGGYREYPDT